MSLQHSGKGEATTDNVSTVVACYSVSLQHSGEGEAMTDNAPTDVAHVRVSLQHTVIRTSLLWVKHKTL